jgi:hypothetical protein
MEVGSLEEMKSRQLKDAEGDADENVGSEDGECDCDAFSVT